MSEPMGVWDYLAIIYNMNEEARDQIAAIRKVDDYDKQQQQAEKLLHDIWSVVQD
jgi:hypothetical protein